VLFAIVLVVILAFTALVVDIGLLRNNRQSLVNAVDAGALAGGTLMPVDGSKGGAAAAVTALINQTVDATYPGLSTGISYRCLVGTGPGNPLAFDSADIAAFIPLDCNPSHALGLISAIVKEAACPVIADIDTNDEEFIEQAARRGIFAYVRHGEQPEMAHAIDVVLSRYAEFSRLHGALRTGATIEQAKGILMERHTITADDAFAELRSRARNTNQTVFDVAEAVTLSYPLFKAHQLDTD